MCDSMIANRNMTRCGYPIFGKASDRAVNEPQPFIFVPAADHAPGIKVKTTRVEVDQVPHTYAMILSKPSWIWGAEIGINEKGVIIGNESVFSREMRTDTVALLGMDILRLCLERADTAEKAVHVLGEVLERYGQGGNCSFDGTFYYDNAFLIADAKEAWHVETAGGFWAAKRILEGSYSISNYLSINYPDLMHKDTVKNAIEKGYPVDDPFDWAKAYVDWSSIVNTSGMLRRVCSLQQMNRPGNQFEVADVITALRSHNSNDEWINGGSCVCMHAFPHFEGDLDCQTTNSMGAVLKPGDFMIFGPGMSTTCVAPFQPFWFDAYSTRQVFAYNEQEEAMNCWIHREGINRAILQGRIDLKEYKAEMHEMEKRWFAKAETVAKSDRQAFVDVNAVEADAFISKWLAIAEINDARPMGTAAFQAWWRTKNEALGKDRRIAY